MKVLLLNGSPHAQGCTNTALREVARGLTDCGVQTEIIHIAKDTIPGCTGCYACRKLGKCVKEDIVNEIAPKLAAADGIILASPVYFASPNASFLAFLGRLYAAHGEKLMYKPCGCIVSARRAGTTAALDVLQKYPMVNEQPLVPSCYWCMVHGSTPDQVRADTEGMRIAYTLGRNMAWMIRALKNSPRPQEVQK